MKKEKEETGKISKKKVGEKEETRRGREREIIIEKDSEYRKKIEDQEEKGMRDRGKLITL